MLPFTKKIDQQIQHLGMAWEYNSGRGRGGIRILNQFKSANAGGGERRELTLPSDGRIIHKYRNKWSSKVRFKKEKKNAETKPVPHKYWLSTTSNHKCPTNNPSKPEFLRILFYNFFDCTLPVGLNFLTWTPN